MPDSTGADFRDRGYAVVRNIVDAQQCRFVRAAMDASERTGRLHHATAVVPQGALNEYSPVGAEALLLHCRPAFEAIAGRALLPAYGFWRIYGNGAELRRHVDRNACEVSASLPIFAEPAGEAWPIHVAGLDGADASVALSPGDAILYQGCNIPHWRDAFPGERQYQVFLHYVYADGDKTAFAFDRRDGLRLHG
ncbi:MAG: hypothetical protein E7773_02300 [Sphingomonas sp.]|uniref:hypothetical protein n=1 Tax=Sphingomonas sp. TaxID=28214 RepID=UPI00121C8F16|nr:hypothetical protein [Sphingomonas sp.]THD37830.1 MAG: hypothetical protein E7773_02300 [Sphingomonas sp.]